MNYVVLAIAAFGLLHFLADFVLQSDWMAKGKSRSNEILAEHCMIYALILTIGTFLMACGLLGCDLNISKFLITYAIYFMSHFVVDYVTSRATSNYFAAADFHNAFVVIGLDQWIHMITIAVITKYAIGII